MRIATFPAASALLLLAALWSCEGTQRTTQRPEKVEGTVEDAGIRYYTGSELLPPPEADGTKAPASTGSGSDPGAVPLAPLTGPTSFDVSEFSAEDERVIGEATARHILALHDLLPPQHPLSAYVHKVGALLSLSASRPEVRYRFAVLITPELDSCAAPDGWVFITTGLLRFLENEAELAFILAHEICHVEQRDGLEMLAKAQGDLAKRAMRKRMAALASQPAGEVEQELQARMDELSDLVLRGKGLPQEVRADAFALRLIQKTGYQPTAVRALFERLAAFEEPGAVQPLIFRSHPHLSERAASAAREAERLPSGGVLLAERLAAALDSIAEQEESR